LTGEWHDAVRSEIQPRLKLLPQGVMLISQIELHRAVGRSREFYDLEWDSERGSYALRKDNECGDEAEMEVICYEWMSLDDSSPAGFDYGRPNTCVLRVTIPLIT
jgi:hypothetical protein